jgi:hypothetical protein
MLAKRMGAKADFGQNRSGERLLVAARRVSGSESITKINRTDVESRKAGSLLCPFHKTLY